MEKVSLLIENRYQLLYKFIGSSSKIFAITKSYIEGVNLSEYKIVSTALEYLNSVSFTTPDTIAGFIDLYDTFAKVLVTMDAMLNILTSDKYNILFSKDMTMVKNIEANSEKSRASSIKDDYIELSVIDDDAIFNIVFDTYKPKDVSVVNSERINKFVIALVGYFIKTVPDSSAKLHTIIESQKDALLESGRSTEFKDSILGSLQGNLIPVCEFTSIEKLFVKIDPDISVFENSTIEDICNKSSVKKNIGFVILNRTTKSILEFDIRGLISSEYIQHNDLVIDSRSGLTKKFIQRFNTVRKMESTIETPGAIMRIIPSIIYGRGTKTRHEKYPKAKNPIYVIETFTPGLYRLLSTSVGQLYVDIDDIPGLLKGISTRPLQYNDIVAREIHKKCFDEKAQMVLSSYSDEKSSKISPDAIKEALVRKYKNIIDNTKIASYTDFRNILLGSREEIENVLVPLLMSFMTDNPTPEIVLTYISKVNSIVAQFIREIEGGFNRSNVSASLFTGSSTDIKRQTTDIILEIVLNAFKELNKANKWTEYNYTLKEHFIDVKFITF